MNDTMEKIVAIITACPCNELNIPVFSPIDKIKMIENDNSKYKIDLTILVNMQMQKPQQATFTLNLIYNKEIA